MEIERLDWELSVCKVKDEGYIDLQNEPCFVGKTDEELSLVCQTNAVPLHTLAREDGWRAFRIRGILDFSLIGILAEISALLAECKIGIFALSTYNTDYILVKQEQYEQALAALDAAGYTVVCA